MKKNVILPNLRISTEQHIEIQKAIETFNSNNVFELNESGYRRLAYKVLAQMIQTGQRIPINFQSVIK